MRGGSGSTKFRWGGVVGVAVVLVLLGGACSGSGGGEATNTTTSIPTDTSTTAPEVATTTLPALGPAIERNLDVVLEQPDDLPGYNVHRPADLDALGEPLPVVVWANGACLRHDRPWLPMFDRWAQAGFVVISITRPPGVGPDAPLTEVGSASAEDQALAIDWAATQNEVDGPYQGRLDLARVVAAGNSCGGITSLALAGQDDRVAAVFVLSGSSIGPGATREQAAEIMDRVQVPVGYVVGGEEDIARAQALQDVDLLGEGLARFVALRSTGDHWAVSTDEALVVESAEIALHWLDLVVWGTPEAADLLVEEPCGLCASETWTVEAANLASLVRD